MEFNLADLFEAVVDSVPDRLALIAGDERFTYRELDERANRVADHLAAAGIGPGDPVGLHLLNGNEYLESMLGCFKLRAVPVNVNYRYVAQELAYLYRDAGLRALIHDARFAEAVAGALSDDDAPPHLLEFDPADDGGAYERALDRASPTRRATTRSADDHYVIYTGGTTGLPKGVVWRHEDLFFAALGGGDRYHQGDVITRPEEIVDRVAEEPVTTLVCAPLMHGNAQWTSLGTLLGGGVVVLLPDGRLGPDELRHAIGDLRVNLISLVGDAMARPLIDVLATGDLDTSSIIAVASGGALLSPVNKARLSELLPAAMVIDGMGSSEAGVLGQRAVAAADEEGPPRFSVNASTTVFGPDDHPVEPGSGMVGQLARSGHLPIGYQGDPDKTAATFRVVNGTRWAFTGDAATVHADGSIELLGRGSGSINTGGEKVYPEEVEAVLKGHPAVRDVIVVGVPDETWGERIVAVVQPADDAAPSLESLQELTRQHLAGYKAPRSLHLVDEVVRSPAGKPDYRWARTVAVTSDGPD